MSALSLTPARLAAVAIGATALSAGAHAAPTYATLGFAGTANIQQNLIATGPAGSFTTSNGFATPFFIPPTGANYYEVNASRPFTLTGLSLSNATDVYTLINAYGPVPGAIIGAITFGFSDGTSVSDPLVAGANVRDFFRGGFVNTLTDSSAENAFTFITSGGAGTGNTSTGPAGTYYVDEQDFRLGSVGLGRALTGIEITSTGGNGINSGSGNGTPILLGLTAAYTPVAPANLPEGGAAPLLFAGLAGLAAARRWTATRQA